MNAHDESNSSDAGFTGERGAMPGATCAYESPDHWRRPPDTAEIPYSFAASPRPNADHPGRF